jgi:hypothetical protein
MQVVVRTWLGKGKDSEECGEADWKRSVPSTASGEAWATPFPWISFTEIYRAPRITVLMA